MECKVALETEGNNGMVQNSPHIPAMNGYILILVLPPQIGIVVVCGQ